MDIEQSNKIKPINIYLMKHFDKLKGIQGNIYNWIFNMSNMMGTPSGAETASDTLLEFTPGFKCDSCCSIF